MTMLSKPTKNSILVTVLVVLNLVLLYRLNLGCVSNKSNKIRISEKNGLPMDVRSNLSSLTVTSNLSLVSFINEQHCNFCNSQVLINLEFFAKNYPKDLFLFINGSNQFLEYVTKRFKSLENKIIKKFSGNSLSNPICLVIDRNKKCLMLLEADLYNVEEIHLFFERSALLFDAFYSKNKD